MRAVLHQSASEISDRLQSGRSGCVHRIDDAESGTRSDSLSKREGVGFNRPGGAVADRDPACTSDLDPLLWFKGYPALQTYRAAHWLWVRGRRDLAKGNYNVGFYVAACPKNGADVPWSGVSAMLRVLCGIQDGDDWSHPQRLERQMAAFDADPRLVATLSKSIRSPTDPIRL